MIDDLDRPVTRWELIGSLAYLAAVARLLAQKGLIVEAEVLKELDTMARPEAPPWLEAELRKLFATAAD